MQETIDLLDVVALTVDLPEKRLFRGQVGTVVEELASGVYEIEFSDVATGQAYAMLHSKPISLWCYVTRPRKPLNVLRLSTLQTSSLLL